MELAGTVSEMEYKFICCSDTHEKLPPNLDDTNASAWLHAGDVYDMGHRYRRPSFPERQQKLLMWLESRKMPVLAVRGNHDCSYKHEFIDKSDAGGRCVSVAPKLWVVGVGWAGGAFYDLPEESDLESICVSAQREITRKAMPGDSFIVLAHYPPLLQGVNPFVGNPTGWISRKVGELVDQIKPIAVVQGHIHGYFGMQDVYVGASFNTMILAPGPRGGVLYVDPEASTARYEPAPVPENQHGLTDFI